MTKDAIEQAYSFLHQKYRVFQYSRDDRQKEDIEYAVTSFVETMRPDLYDAISQGQDDYLFVHSKFAVDLPSAVQRLEQLMETL